MCRSFKPTPPMKPCFCRSFLLIVLVLCLSAFGCATSTKSPAPETDDSRQSVIKVDSARVGQGRLQITKVDDDPTVGYWRRMSGHFVGEVRVAPGEHRIWAKLDYGTSFAWGHLWLVAEPAEVYVLKVRSQGYSVLMWIENERTGQLVGGYVKSPNEQKEQ
jgi:hypothetical protein